MSLPPNGNGGTDGNAPLMHKAVTNLIKNKTTSSSNLKRSYSNDTFYGGKQKLVKGVSSASTQNLSRMNSNTPQSNIFDPVNLEALMNERLKFFNLDFGDDTPEETFRDPNSRYFTRDFGYKYNVDDCIPFETEGFSQQSKYLCHVLVNLYISISSRDIQGIVPISAKDISSFKSDIEMVFGTDMLQLNTSDYGDDESVVSQGDYDTFEDEEDDEEAEKDAAHGVGVGGKINVKSSTIVNVVYWTTELSKCLHFEIPVSLRKSLCMVYYSLALSRGQKINRILFVDTFVDLLEALGEQSYNCYRKVLKQSGLLLDYKPLLDYFLDFLPDPEASYQKRDVENRNDHKLLRLLLKLAHNARTFFDSSSDKCLTDITQFIVSSLSPKTVSSVLPILASIVPYHYFENKSSMDLFKLAFSIWKNSVINATIDVQWYQFLSEMISEGYTQMITIENPDIIAKSKIEFGEFGFLNEEQIDFIFNRLRLSMIKESSVASFSAIITAIIYSINSEKMLTKVKNLMNSMATYFHPSNTDVWSSLCARFVMTFIKIYHERCKLEQQESSKYRKDLNLKLADHATLVDIFQGPILLGSFSKDFKDATYHISSLAYLLDLNPPNKSQLMDKILMEVYTPYPHSIEREGIALKQFGRIARFYCSTDIYRMHITNVMTMIINKIDANDPDMGVPLLNCLLCIVSFTPIAVIDEYKDKDFYSVTQPALDAHLQNIRQGYHETEYNDEFKYAFGVSTTLFKPIVEALITKLFTFVPSKSEESLLFKIAQLFMILIESMDKNMFDFFSENFISHLIDESSYLNCKSPNVDIIAEITGYMLKRNGDLFPQLINMFYLKVDREVERSKGNVRSKQIQERDNKIVFCVRVLDEIFRCGMQQIVEHKKTVEQILFKFFDEVHNPPVDMISPTLVHNILFSLVYPEIIDFKLFPDDCKLSPEEKWGGFTSDERRFSPECMNFKWHLPTYEEVNYAISLSKKLVDYASTNITKIISSEKLSILDKDKIQKYVMILLHVISGLSELFDSDYSEVKKNQRKKNLDSIGQNKEKLAILNYVRKKSVDANAIETGLEQESAALDEDDDEGIDIDYDAAGNGNTGNSLFEDLMSVETTPLPGDSYEFEQTKTTGASAGLVLGNEKITIHQLFNSFGKTDSEKLADPRYDEVHAIHSKIGEVLHTLVSFLKTKIEHDSELLVVVLQCMKCWFVDRGIETFFGEENDYMIDLTLLENIQSLAHVFEPYTRTCIGLRVHMDYKARTTTHSTSRVASPLEKTLLHDILSLCISPYPHVCGSAQFGLNDIMKQILGSHKICIKFLLENLEQSIKKNDDLVIKSILECLTLPKISMRIGTDYHNLSRLFDLLLTCNSHSNFSVVLTSEELLMQLSSSIKVPSSICLFNFDSLNGIAPDDKALQIEIEAVTNAKNQKRKEIFALLKTFEEHVKEKIKGISDPKSPSNNSDSEAMAISNEEEEEDVDMESDHDSKDEELSEWKGQLFLGEIIHKLQISNEYPIDLSSLKQLFDQTLSDHPDTKQKSMYYFTNLVSNVLVRAEIGYNNEIIYSPCFKRPLIKTVDTSEAGFREYYEQQLVNYDNPDFFVDAKPYSGFVSLGWPLYAVSSDKAERLNLQIKSGDKAILDTVCKEITPEYLTNTIEYLIKDKETKSEYTPVIVFFFVSIIQMINLGIAKLITYDDILAACENTFDRTSNASIITSGEIFASLIVASNYTSAENMAKRDDFIEEFMKNHILKNINTNILDSYAVMFWWLPGQVDIRRCKTLYEKVVLSVNEVLSENRGNAISPALIAGRINFARYLLMGLNSTSEHNQKLVKMFGVFNHPDEPVRKAIANTINFLLLTDTQKKFDSVDHLMSYVSKNDEDNLGNSIKAAPEWFNDLILEQFDWIFNEYKNNETYYTTTDAVKIIHSEFFYRASTIYLIFAGWSHNNLLSLPHYFEQIAKFLSILYGMKNVCNMTNIHPEVLFEQLGSSTMTKVTLEIVLDGLFDFKNKKIFNTSHGYKIQLNFIQSLYSSYIYLLNPQQVEDIVTFVKNMLSYQGSLEVRELAGKVLSGMIHTMGEDSFIVSELCDTFGDIIKKAGNTLEKKQKYVALSKKNEAEIHGAVVGLSSVVNAFPYIQPIPKWIPESLSILSGWTRFTGFIGQAVKNAITDFKKNRSDTWHIDKEYFTLDQLEDLEGVNWRSYYA